MHLAEKELELQVLRDIVKKLLTIYERRLTAKMMTQSGITARRAGEILNIPLSTIYYQSTKADRDNAPANTVQVMTLKHTFYINPPIQIFMFFHFPLIPLYPSIKPSNLAKAIESSPESLYCITLNKFNGMFHI